MRLKLPELLEAHGHTPYTFARAVAATGRVTEAAAYRLVKDRGVVASFHAEMLEAMCEVLDVEPGKLLERERRKGAHEAQRASQQAERPARSAAKRSPRKKA